ncbi:hypothetical protein JCM10207_006499 [Rhodosporidiobolus poonsookiae]
MPPKLTNPLRPAARYRPGKAPVPVAESDSDDDDQQQQHDEVEQEEDEDEGVTEFAAPRQQDKGARMNVALSEVEVDQLGKVKVGGRDEVGRTQMESSEGEYETDSEEEAQPPPKPTFRPQAGAATAKAAADEESSEYETDSEEEEEPLKPLYKPVFVSKRNRDTLEERKKELDPELQEAKREAELQKQRDASKNLVADSILRELAQKEAEVTHPDVDDTDGVDPEGEFEAWKLRELMRLKRDKEARYALEKVREEVEARRAMPEELRLKEDTARADKSRKDKPKGNKAFLERYHHKGVFHADSEILKKHDFTAPTASTVQDVSSLPSVMQKRNFGKAHQTKYTHLAAEDTSRGGGGWGKETRPGGGGGAGGAGGSGQGCFNCGGPHLKRDCPNLDPSTSAASGVASGSGANRTAAATGGDAGWGGRAPPPHLRREDERGADRYAPGGGGGGGGRRAGVGYGAGARRDDDRYGGERRPRSRSRSRERRRSRSPPPRYRDERDRDGPRGGRREREYDDRDRDRDRDRERDYRRRERSRSRSRSPPRGGRDRRDDREREDKRRRVEYD